MNITEDIIIQFLEGELDTKQQTEFLTEIAEDQKLLKVYEEYKFLYDGFSSANSPELPNEVEDRFQAFLAMQSKNTSKSKIKPSWIIGIVFLICIAATIIFKNYRAIQDNNEQMFAMQHQVKTLMGNQSSSYRIKAVNLSANQPSSNTQAIDLLLDAIMNDRSSNVRLAALESLKQHIENDKVRATIYTAMAHETDAVVLLTYINILSASKEKEATTALKNLTQQESLEQFLKDEAQLGLFKLESY